MKPTITLCSAYRFHADNAHAIRMRHFFEELRKKFDVQVIFPFFPLAGNNAWALWRLSRELFAGAILCMRLLFSKKDLVVLSWPPYVTVLMAALLLIVMRRKYILDIRDPYPEVFFELGIFPAKSPLGRLFTRLNKLVMKHSSGLSVATEGIRQIVDSYGTGAKIVSVFNGFDPNVFYKSKETFENFTMVFHGNLGKMQNIDLLCTVAQKCPSNIDIVVVGNGPQRPKVQGQKRIKFLGQLSHEDVAKVIRHSHIGLSLRNDGLMGKISFPVKVFEYMGAGLPVIATPHSEAGRFLEKNGLGWQFHNSQVSEIVDKIVSLREHKWESPSPPLEFSRQKQAKKFLQFMTEVIDQPLPFEQELQCQKIDKGIGHDHKQGPERL